MHSKIQGKRGLQSRSKVFRSLDEIRKTFSLLGLCSINNLLILYVQFQANLSKNPLEVYNYMYSEGVCDQVAKFYIELAWEQEQRNNFKKAEQTFKVAGLKITNSEDKELVLTKHKQFQARVMKRMLETSSDEVPEPAEEQRTALSSLKSQGKHGKVGSLRVGAAKKSENPGVLTASGQLPKPSGNGQFTIFQESSQDNENVLPGSSKTSSNNPLPFSRGQNRENERDPGKWTQSRIGKKAHAVPLDQISTKPGFQVHQDEGLVTPSKSSCMTPSHVLTSHKPKPQDDDDVPIALALFEPPDPTKKPMYCKHLVYQGTTEFSFEELRGARYWQKIAAEEAEAKRREKMLLEKEMFEKRQDVEKELLKKRQEFEREQAEQRQAFMLEQEKMQSQMMQMMEGLKRQQEEIEAMKRQQQSEAANSRKNDVDQVAAEFTVPTKPARKVLGEPGFKIYSDNSDVSQHSQQRSTSR